MIRTAKVPFLQSRAALPVMLLTSAIIACGIILPFSVFGSKLGLQPLPASYFAWLFVMLLSYGALVQVVKGWYIRKFATWL